MRRLVGIGQGKDHESTTLRQAPREWLCGLPLWRSTLMPTGLGSEASLEATFKWGGALDWGTSKGEQLWGWVSVLQGADKKHNFTCSLDWQMSPGEAGTQASWGISAPSAQRSPFYAKPSTRPATHFSLPKDLLKPQTAYFRAVYWVRLAWVSLRGTRGPGQAPPHCLCPYSQRCGAV